MAETRQTENASEEQVAQAPRAAESAPPTMLGNVGAQLGGRLLQRKLAMRAARRDGAPIQRKISIETLEQKRKEIEASGSYQGTLDEDTDAVTANQVGEQWTGDGRSSQKYGPPFNFQYLSADKKFQYRPPMVKKNSAMRGKAQANYEWRRKDGGNFAMNAHVTVSDIDKHLAKEGGEGGETGGETKTGE